MIDRICSLLRFLKPVTADAGYLFASGATVPTDATAGYQKGCIFQHTDGTGAGDVFYINEGTVASCDFNAISALTAAQEALLAAVAGTVTASTAVIVDANKDASDFRNIGYSGAVTSKGGAAAAAVVARFGKTATEGLEVKVIDEIVTLTNAAATALTSKLPAGGVVLSSQINLNTAVVGDASGDNGLTKVGVGISSDPDKYGKTAVLTLNAKADVIPDWAVISSEETVGVYATDNDGAAVTEKFVAAGLVRVRIVYLTTNSLDDAA
jgi:hypothetical protein